MTDEPDFRADKSDSVEGGGKPADRLYAYLDSLDEDVVAEAFPMQAIDRMEQYDELVRDDIAEDAMEQWSPSASGSPGTWPAASPPSRRAAGTGPPSSARSGASHPLRHPS